MKESHNSRFAARLKKLSLSAAIIFYAIFLIAFAWIGKSFGVDLAGAALSFALLGAPYWFLGFGLDRFLIRVLNRRWKRLIGAGALIVPWLVYAVPQGQFDIRMFAGLLAAILAVSGLLELSGTASAGHWSDWAALAVLAFAVELPYFRHAWNAPGLSGLSKLVFVDTGLFGFMVIRPIGGIGFTLRPRWSDFACGLREFCFYAPIALLLGFAFGFLHWRPAGFPITQSSVAWLFTLFFVAIPEEIFFRGLMFNMMERRWGARTALIASSLIFGLAHFPKRGGFNWPYSILAAIAGVFYGRAWLAHRRVLASGVTHATVDAVWSVWFR